MSECVCDSLIFCKRCYSKIYYQINRERVLEYQKIRYNKNKKKKFFLNYIKGNYIINFN